jgi:hypothetical protein
MDTQGGQGLQKGGCTAAANLAVPVKADRIHPQGSGSQGQEQRRTGVPHINADGRPIGYAADRAASYAVSITAGSRSPRLPPAPYFPADKALSLSIRGIGTQGIYGAVFNDCGAQDTAGGSTGTGIQRIQGIIDLRNPLRQGSNKEPPDSMGLGRGNTNPAGKTVRFNTGDHTLTLTEERFLLHEAVPKLG